MDKPSEIYKIIFENTGTAMVIVEEDTIRETWRG